MRTALDNSVVKVNKAVTSLDEVTQRRTALVEQAAAAAHSLLEQAGGLEAIMSKYVVSEDQRESRVA